MAEQRAKDAQVCVAPSTIANTGEASGSRIEEGDFVTSNEQRDLVRGLHQRHISLIAIAGAIVSTPCPRMRMQS